MDPRPRGFEEWYRAEHPRLLAAMVLVAGDLDVARDATDEALSRALERWERVSAMESPGGWCYRVAVNVLRRRMRRAAVERRFLLRHLPERSVPAPAGEAWDAVARLPERQRLAVVLRHVAMLTEQEVANVMGVARGTVSRTLRTAYARLAEGLREPTAEEGASDRA